MGSVSSYHDKEHQNAYCRCLIDREQHMHCDKEHQNAYFDPVSLQRLPGFSARATVSQTLLRSLEKCTHQFRSALPRSAARPLSIRRVGSMTPGSGVMTKLIALSIQPRRYPAWLAVNNTLQCATICYLLHITAC